MKKIGKSQIQLTRSQKILVSLYELADGKNKQVRFEDIAVLAFKNFSSDFQLKGYPQYPDTGDIIHKPLYSTLKQHGYVLSGNKYFSLTPSGIEYVKQLIGQLDKSVNKDAAKNKLNAVQQKELERLKDSTAVHLFIEGKEEEILDIDFYSYLGVTVRTNKYDFLGRLNSVEDTVIAIKNRSEKLYKGLLRCHKYLLNRFKQNIEFVKNSKGGKR